MQMPNLLAAISGVQRFVRNTRRNSIVTREKEQARCAAAARCARLLHAFQIPPSRPGVRARGILLINALTFLTVDAIKYIWKLYFAMLILFYIYLFFSCRTYGITLKGHSYKNVCEIIALNYSLGLN
jgi:hypothetical protein